MTRPSEPSAMYNFWSYSGSGEKGRNQLLSPVWIAQTKRMCLRSFVINTCRHILIAHVMFRNYSADQSLGQFDSDRKSWITKQRRHAQIWTWLWLSTEQLGRLQVQCLHICCYWKYRWFFFCFHESQTDGLVGSIFLLAFRGLLFWTLSWLAILLLGTLLDVDKVRKSRAQNSGCLSLGFMVHHGFHSLVI